MSDNQVRGKAITFILLLVALSLIKTTMVTSGNTAFRLRKLGSVDTGYGAFDVWVENEIAYVTCGYDGFKIYDVSDPSKIVELAHLPEGSGGYAHQLFFNVENSIAFIGDGHDGVRIINCTQTTDPVDIISNLPIGGYPYDIHFIGNIAYIADAERGLLIVDFQDIMNPIVLGSYNHDVYGDAYNIEIRGNIAFLSAGISGTYVINIENSSNPVLKDHYVGLSSSGVHAIDLKLYKDNAFISYWPLAVELVDISNLTDLTTIKQLSEGVPAATLVHPEFDILYIADMSNGLKLLNITDPVNSEEIAQIPDTSDAYRMFLSDNFLYLTIQSGQLIIFEQTSSTYSSPGISFLVTFLFLMILIVFSGRKRMDSAKR
jgi:hypothetical protein